MKYKSTYTKYIAVVLIALGFQGKALADTTVTAFGPARFSAKSSGSTTTKSFTSQAPPTGDLPAIIEIENGFGQDIVLLDCNGMSSRNKLVCKIKNGIQSLIVALLNPEKVRVALNGSQVFGDSQYQRAKGHFEIPVRIKKQNSLQVYVKGFVTNSVTVRIKVLSSPVNQNPLANFDYAPTQAIAPALISFSGLLSSDPDGVISSYQWDFGDGQSSSGAMVTHVYTEPGSYQVRLTVTDQQGASGTQTQTVIMAQNQLPIAAFTTTTTTDSGQMKINTDGSASMDSDGSIAQYRWNFGDGSTEVVGDASTAKLSSHVYTQAGTYNVTLTVIDDKGGSGSSAQSVVIADIRPIADLKVTPPPSNVAPMIVLFDASGSSSPQGKTLHFRFDFGDGEIVGSDNGVVSHFYQSAGQYTATLTVVDTSNMQAEKTSTIVAVNPVLPPSAEEAAPPLSTTSIQPMAESVRFLFEGENPVQNNVQNEAIDPNRIAVVHGVVMDQDGGPLSGVKISILEMPELGQTITQQDGHFYMVVNGGGTVTVKYERNGYFPVQRKVVTTAFDYFAAEKIVMLSPDENKMQVQMASGEAQMVRGPPVTDSSGQRSSVLMIPAGTTAQLQMPNGSLKSVGTLTLRSTEYTVGDQGPARMPAPLPATTSYTYAVEISADEALANGAEHVIFSNPVPYYVDNFLDFPTGTAVPFGIFNAKIGAWEAENDGVVASVLNIQNGQAVLDLDGSGAPASATLLSQLNISADELAKIAEVYPVGKSFWRVQVNHLTPLDLNFLADAPNLNNLIYALPFVGRPKNCPCDPTSTGSIIGINQQSLGENLGIAGVPTVLNYQSMTKPGRLTERQISIPLNAPTGSVDNIHLTIEAAGQIYEEDLAPSTKSKIWTWDGKDAFGRIVKNPVSARVTLDYEVGSLYKVRNFVVDFKSFDTPTVDFILSRTPVRKIEKISRSFDVSLGNLQTLNGADVGGWTLSQVHQYNPFAKVLTLGDGTVIDAKDVTPIVVTLAGKGSGGEGGYAFDLGLTSPRSIAVGPDSSIYIYDASQFNIYKIGPDGIVQKVLTQPFVGGLAVGSDGSLYYSIYSTRSQINKVLPDGSIQVVAGTGSFGFSGDGGPATSALLHDPKDIIISKDGTIYFYDDGNRRIRKVNASGQISTVAGNGGYSTLVDGVALSVGLPTDLIMAAGPNNELYLLNSYLIKVLTPDGTIRHVAGTTNGTSGDEGPAATAQLGFAAGIDVANDGTIYFTERISGRIRSITPDGIIHTVAAHLDTSLPQYASSVESAMNSSQNPWALKLYGKDSFIFSDTTGHRIKRYQPALPALSDDGYSIGSKDGSEIYQFSPMGLHQRTLYAKTGKPKWIFSYDNQGRIISMKDGDGKTTQIQRDSQGFPQAIIGPYGQTSTLSVNSDGYLTSVTSPLGQSTQMQYDSKGLLTEFRKPKGNASTFEYNSSGELIKDSDAAGGFKTLTKTSTDDLTYVVEQRTAMGRVTQHSVDSGTSLSTTVYRTTTPDGYTEVQQAGKTTQSHGVLNGSYSSSSPDLDPRLGGITQFYSTNVSVRGSGGTTRVVSKTYYTPLSSADFFKYIQITDLDINGTTLTQTYNSNQRKISVETGFGRMQSVIIDDQERPVLSTSGTLAPVQYQYDDSGNVVLIQQGDRATSFAYNSLGQLSSVTDAEGQSTQFGWDVSGRLIQQMRADGTSTVYGYDANNNLASLQPPDEAIHQFAVNLVDLFSIYAPPTVSNGGETSYLYDLDRNITTESRANGHQLIYTYKSSGLLSKIQGASKSIAYQISNIRNAASAYSATSSDGIAIVRSATEGVNFDSSYSGQVVMRIKAERGDRSQLNTIRFNTSTELVFPNQYDADGMQIQAGHMTLSRDADNGILTSTQLLNVQEDYQYNSFGEKISSNARYNSTAISTFSYTRDRLGRVTSKTETILGATLRYDYAYDLAGRLSEVSVNGVATNHYAYDSNGNRLSMNTDTATYDAQDRLTHYKDTEYSYDGHGTLIQKQKGTEITRYDWDDFGQISKATLPSGKVIEYLIDGEAHRSIKKVDGVITRKYVYYSNGMLAGELNADNTVRAVYLYGSEAHSPDYMYVPGGVIYRMLKDQLGSIRVVINAQSGLVVQRMDYDEFGNVIQDTSPGLQPFGFAGGIYDGDTGLVHFGARDYDPEIGRWTSKDPVLFRGKDSNLYGYVFNDPINFIDPKGLWSVSLGFFNGFGLGVTFGVNPDGFAFGSVKAGVGYGGGASYDPQGQSSSYGTCSNKDFSIGQYAEAGANIGAFEAAVSTSSGYGQSRGAYANPPGLSGAVTPSIGIGAGFSGGLELSWH